MLKNVIITTNMSPTSMMEYVALTEKIENEQKNARKNARKKFWTNIGIAVAATLLGAGVGLVLVLSTIGLAVVV